MFLVGESRCRTQDPIHTDDLMDHRHSAFSLSLMKHQFYRAAAYGVPDIDSRFGLSFGTIYPRPGPSAFTMPIPRRVVRLALARWGCPKKRAGCHSRPFVYGIDAFGWHQVNLSGDLVSLIQDNLHEAMFQYTERRTSGLSISHSRFSYGNRRCFCHSVITGFNVDCCIFNHLSSRYGFGLSCR